MPNRNERNPPDAKTLCFPLLSTLPTLKSTTETPAFDSSITVILKILQGQLPFLLGLQSQFQNGKMYKKVTLFGYSWDFVFFCTAQVAERKPLEKICLVGLSGLHSLLSNCYAGGL